MALVAWKRDRPSNDYSYIGVPFRDPKRARWADSAWISYALMASSMKRKRDPSDDGNVLGAKARRSEYSEPMQQSCMTRASPDVKPTPSLPTSASLKLQCRSYPMWAIGNVQHVRNLELFDADSEYRCGMGTVGSVSGFAKALKDYTISFESVCYEELPHLPNVTTLVLKPGKPINKNHIDIVAQSTISAPKLEKVILDYSAVDQRDYPCRFLGISMTGCTQRGSIIFRIVGRQTSIKITNICGNSDNVDQMIARAEELYGICLERSP